MAPYSEKEEIKEMLHLNDDHADDELVRCVSIADAFIDAECTKAGVTVPSPIPKLVNEASRHLAAYYFRMRNSPPRSVTGETASHPSFYSLGKELLDSWLSTQGSTGALDFAYGTGTAQ